MNWRPGGLGISGSNYASAGHRIDLAPRDTVHATYANTIGSAEFMGSWTDPEFNPKLEDVPAVIQERAWSSPIWYNAGS